MPPVPKKNPPPLPFQLPTSDRISLYRKAKGLSQEALAQLIGISRKKISDYELGRAHPNDETIVRLSLALEVTSDVLLGLDDQLHSEEPFNLRFTRRIRELEKLSEIKKKAILKTLDDLIRANS